MGFTWGPSSQAARAAENARAATRRREEREGTATGAYTQGHYPKAEPRSNGLPMIRRAAQPHHRGARPRDPVHPRRVDPQPPVVVAPPAPHAPSREGAREGLPQPDVGHPAQPERHRRRRAGAPLGAISDLPVAVISPAAHRPVGHPCAGAEAPRRERRGAREPAHRDGHVPRPRRDAITELAGVAAAPALRRPVREAGAGVLSPRRDLHHVGP